MNLSEIASKIGLLTSKVEALPEASALRAEVATLTADRDKLASQLSALTAERDSAKSALAALTTERDTLASKVTALEAEAKSAPAKAAEILAKTGHAGVPAGTPAASQGGQKVKLPDGLTGLARAMAANRIAQGLPVA